MRCYFGRYLMRTERKWWQYMQEGEDVQGEGKRGEDVKQEIWDREKGTGVAGKYKV